MSPSRCPLSESAKILAPTALKERHFSSSFPPQIAFQKFMTPVTKLHKNFYHKLAVTTRIAQFP